MTQPFTLNLPVTIRPAQQDDLPKLEWFGLHTSFRVVMERDFWQSRMDFQAYLVADVNNFPVGQVQAHLETHRYRGAGYIMALRVLDPFQNLGVGSRLMTAVEQSIFESGLLIAELHVDKNNHHAERFYKNRGYQIVGEDNTPWSYVTPEGEVQTLDAPEWVMQKRLKDTHI